MKKIEPRMESCAPATKLSMRLIKIYNFIENLKPQFDLSLNISTWCQLLSKALVISKNTPRVPRV